MLWLAICNPFDTETHYRACFAAPGAVMTTGIHTLLRLVLTDQFPIVNGLGSISDQHGRHEWHQGCCSMAAVLRRVPVLILVGLQISSMAQDLAVPALRAVLVKQCTLLPHQPLSNSHASLCQAQHSFLLGTTPK